MQSLVAADMPGLARLVRELMVDSDAGSTSGSRSRPLEGVRVCGSVHLTYQTLALIRTLQRLGATVQWCACNPATTNDDVVAAANALLGVHVFARAGQSVMDHWHDKARALRFPVPETDGQGLPLPLAQTQTTPPADTVIEHNNARPTPTLASTSTSKLSPAPLQPGSWQGPDVIIDDGGHLLTWLTNAAHMDALRLGSNNSNSDVSATKPSVDPAHPERRVLIDAVYAETLGTWQHALRHCRGVCEQTTSGVLKARDMAAHGRLYLPVMRVNDAIVKCKVDNVLGCMQSLLAALHTLTHWSLAGKRVLVVGFGDVGKGAARGLAASGARVLVSEIDPVCALQAHLQGFEVQPVADALPGVDMVVTATGCPGVLTPSLIRTMRSGSVLANLGHGGLDIDVRGMHATPLTPHVSAVHLDATFPTTFSSNSSTSVTPSPTFIHDSDPEPPSFLSWGNNSTLPLSTVGQGAMDRVKASLVSATATGGRVPPSHVQRFAASPIASASSDEGIHPMLSPTTSSARHVYLLTGGMGANLVAAGGNPSGTMSCTMTTHVLAVMYLLGIATFNLGTDSPLGPGMHRVPRLLEEHVARLHLPNAGAELDVLSHDQAAFLSVEPTGPFKGDDYAY